MNTIEHRLNQRQRKQKKWTYSKIYMEASPELIRAEFNCNLDSVWQFWSSLDGLKLRVWSRCIVLFAKSRINQRRICDHLWGAARWRIAAASAATCSLFIDAFTTLSTSGTCDCSYSQSSVESSVFFIFYLNKWVYVNRIDRLLNFFSLVFFYF